MKHRIDTILVSQRNIQPFDGRDIPTGHGQRCSTAVICRRVAWAAALASAATNVCAQTKWDLASAYPATNFHVENLISFAQEVDKATAGALKITVHGAASLFKGNEIKRAVQGGLTQAGELLLANLENENPIFGADGIPFLATSYAEARKLADAQKPILEKLLASQGIKLLYTVPWQPNGIFVNKELSSAADMRGLKWRAYSPATSKIGELVGAYPVTILAAELPQALATGVVNSFMIAGAAGYDYKYYESIKYFYNVRAWIPKNAVVVNQRAFSALDPATQAAVLKAAGNAEVRGWKISEEKDGWALKALREKGMKVVLNPSPKLLGDLKQIGSVLLADWEKKAGPDGQTLIGAYRKE